MGESLWLVTKREYEGTGVEEQRGKPCWGTTEGSLRASQLQRVPCRGPYS